jgi:DEAD/DEAH box helicase domain-containing protein
MPEQEIHTTAYWLHFPAEFLSSFAEWDPAERQNGIQGIGNALRTVAALHLMCDPRDLGVAHGEGNLYLYDAAPGGSGLSEPLFRCATELQREALDLIESCACENGCPACTGPEGEIGMSGKPAAVSILLRLSSAKSDFNGQQAAIAKGA